MYLFFIYNMTKYIYHILIYNNNNNNLFQITAVLFLQQWLYDPNLATKQSLSVKLTDIRDSEGII